MKIGNKNNIAFEIIDENLSKDLWNLNFYLGGKLISNEAVYVPTYHTMFEKFSNQLSKKQFENSKFDRSTLKQQFNTLIKKRDSNENQFFKHLLQIDETIDQYTIFAFQTEVETSLIWICWDEQNCNSDHMVNKIYSVSFLTEELISTINKLTEEMKKQSANKI